MKLYFIAGEQSGDFIGSKVIESLMYLRAKEQNYKPLIIEGVGGNLMSRAGLSSLFSIDQINMMGFLEILPHIFKILKLINLTVTDIIHKNPDIVITIDSPGFTYRVAQKIKKLAPHIKLYHIVAPSVWAYKPSRARKYAKIYDHLLTLLPFEPEYFIKEGLNASCIGHPVFEQLFERPGSNIKGAFNISTGDQVIAITPGSRIGEIKRHLPVIKESLNRISLTRKITAIFVQSDESNILVLKELLNDAQFNYVFSTNRLSAFAISDCALAKSGTNNLEITASGIPMVVGYKLNPISFLILRLMIKVKFANLVNIMARKEIIPEYIQSDFIVSNIVGALSDFLSDASKGRAQVKVAQKILGEMGFKSDLKPSEQAARIILGLT